MVVKAPPFRFTVEQYDQMIETGILSEDDRVELIRGEIVPKMPSDPPHAGTIKRLIRLIDPQLRGRAILGVQDPVHLADSEPEPDLSILHLSPDDYTTRHPATADIFALIEVADSSLDRDQNEKGPLYAENGIIEYWIINLNGGTVLVHRKPQTGGTWADVTTRSPGDTLDIVALPGVTVAVADILP
jgi:Uma2 family endonuclease